MKQEIKLRPMSERPELDRRVTIRINDDKTAQVLKGLCESRILTNRKMTQWEQETYFYLPAELWDCLSSDYICWIYADEITFTVQGEEA